MRVLLHILIIKKDILVLRRGPTQGLESTLTTEKMHSINFTLTKKDFTSVSITMKQIVTYLVMAQKFPNLKQKILKF